MSSLHHSSYVLGDDSGKELKWEIYRDVSHIIDKNHLYITHWQVKFKTVSSTAFASDKGQKSYTPCGQEWTISSMKANNFFFFFNPQLLAHHQALSKVVDRWMGRWVDRWTDG